MISGRKKISLLHRTSFSMKNSFKATLIFY